MCKFPKLIWITPRGSSTKIPMISACGKCYDCLQSNRAAAVVRCKKEFTNSKSTFFCTLKYSDENLTFWNFNRTERRQELDRLAAIGSRKPFDAYGKFILNKEHASQFFKDMQSLIKSYNSNLLFRIVLNGEYGTWTHRPHYHALIFSPLSFSQHDFQTLLQSVWRYGFASASVVNDARINYCAKHTMKEDAGNELQQKVSPIFRRQSTYRGGIGKDLVNDETLLANYNLENNYTYNGRFKVLIPRYIKKKLHPDVYSEDELLQMSKDSYTTLIRKIFQEFGIKENNIVEYCLGITPRVWLHKYDVSKYDSSSALGADILKYKCAIALYRSRNIDTVKKELHDYYEHKFQNHIQKLKKNGYINEI